MTGKLGWRAIDIWLLLLQVNLIYSRYFNKISLLYIIDDTEAIYYASRIFIFQFMSSFIVKDWLCLKQMSFKYGEALLVWFGYYI